MHELRVLGQVTDADPWRPATVDRPLGRPRPRPRADAAGTVPASARRAPTPPPSKGSPPAPLASALPAIAGWLDSGRVRRAELTVTGAGIAVQTTAVYGQRLYSWAELAAYARVHVTDQALEPRTPTWLETVGVTHWTVLLRVIGEMLDRVSMPECVLQVRVGDAHTPRDWSVRARAEGQVVLDTAAVQRHLRRRRISAAVHRAEMRTIPEAGRSNVLQRATSSLASPARAAAARPIAREVAGAMAGRAAEWAHRGAGLWPPRPTLAADAPLTAVRAAIAHVREQVREQVRLAEAALQPRSADVYAYAGPLPRASWAERVRCWLGRAIELPRLPDWLELVSCLRRSRRAHAAVTPRTRDGSTIAAYGWQARLGQVRAAARDPRAIKKPPSWRLSPRWQ